ncbi:MAG: tRNA pseudouridine(55) synthase TruB [Kofleriaceae bacterium]|nr:tRNA pseudouridine(55) synthase TruB [Kofleriaceae bacterium]
MTHPKQPPLVGIVVVDKPAGLSSAQVVHRIRLALREPRAGHTGTLDPLATGVLPICLNVATKLAGYLIAEDKRYIAQLQLGVETTTLDRLGQVTARASDHDIAAITDAALQQVMAKFVGELAQIPPMFSAIKVDGERLYKKARQGEVVDRTARQVTVHSMRMVARAGALVDIEVHCSKGTYIRSLVDDIGRTLGVGAHIRELRRTASGRFDIAQALPLEQWTRPALAQGLISLETATGLPQVTVDNNLVVRVRHGETMMPDELRIPEAMRNGSPFQLVASGPNAELELLAIAHVAAYRVRYARVFR